MDSNSHASPKTRFPRWTRSCRHWIMREVFVAVLFALLSLAVLNRGPLFSPDSTNYIVAAQNLVQQHSLFVWVNWPSQSLEPVREPYTDYPPGFPLYLAPFILFMHDPVLAAYTAQAVSILLCYGSLAFIMNVLRLGLTYRWAGYLFLCIFATFPHIFSYLWTEPLFIAFSLASGGFALLTLTAGHKKVYWFWSIVLLGMASAIKIIGIFNLAWFAIPLWRTKRHRFTFCALVLFTCLSPILLWFIRNRFLNGQISQSHGFGNTLLINKFQDPILFLKTSALALDTSSKHGFVFLCLLLAILLFAPLLWPWRRHLLVPIAYLRRLVRNPGGRAGDFHMTLLLVAIAHFCGIWILSLLSHFDTLADRLLSPAIILFGIAMLNALAFASGRHAWWFWRALLAATPFVMLMLSGHLVKPKQLPAPQTAGHSMAREAVFWSQMRRSGIYANASHFYSGRNFKHQVFAGMPQRILIREELYSTTNAIQSLAAVGTAPFLVFGENSKELATFEQAWRPGVGGLYRQEFTETGFVVYYQPDSPTKPSTVSARQ
jgi:hypothetical protein